VLTLFPEMFPGPLGHSIPGRATERGLWTLRVHDLRDYTHDRHRTADDYPYGGGAGMVMKPEPIFEAMDALVAAAGRRPDRVILMSPRGRRLDQETARTLAARRHLVFICGHYEGVDERVAESLVDEELSLGDYVLSGGELAAMVTIDATVRLLPGALGEEASLAEESFARGLLEYPQYTRPAVYRGLAVPEILLSGNHGAIARWRRRQALRLTWLRRPDLLAGAELDDEDRAYLEALARGDAPEG